MRRSIVAVAVFLLPAGASAADRTLIVPPGFEVVKVAGPSLVRFPVAAAFDDTGRLYVTDVAGPIVRDEMLAQKPLHRIVRLTDTNHDGTFDEAVTFADGLPLPQGIMWRDGSIYAGCPPKIWKLTDADGDGKADRREVWFDGKTITGCANDLHGPYPGPDGYIYWTKGAFAKQEYTIAGKPFVTRAAHVFRAKPDGSNLEVVMTGGMDNPVDVVFTPTGDMIFSTTFFQHPAGGRRDGLVHAIYGGVYGKDHDPVRDPAHKWTSPDLMPVLTHMGPAAPCGLHRYEGDQFGPDYRDNLFCCQFNYRTVSRHVLMPKGSTYETVDTPFVTSADVEFRPTDVIEDVDGSLLVIDTGGWYKLCCPSAQLVKPDEFGGIYRVRKVGGHKARAKPPAALLPGLYWTALERDRTGLPAALDGLKSPDPHVRRRAAHAVGRIGDVNAVPAVLHALADPTNDRPLDHALTFALIEIGNPFATRSGLGDPTPRVRRATLAALAAMPGDRLEAKAVIGELDAKDLALRETAWWVAGRHPEWGDQLVGYFRDRLVGKPTAELTDRLAVFAAAPAVRDLIADAATRPDTAAVALTAMARARVKPVPAGWLTALAAALRSSPAEAAGAARAVPLPKPVPAPLAAALRAAAADAALPDAVRLNALAALAGLPDDAAFAYLLANSGKEAPAASRAAAADVLASASLSPDRLSKLAAALPSASPTELPRLLDGFAKSTDEAVGLALVTALDTPAVRPSLRVDQLKPVLAKFPAAVQDRAAKLYAELDKARATEIQRLDALVKEMPAGNVRRGEVVFNSQKAACASCHTIGYVGGRVGPDLTRIGGIRADRDLLEAVVFPSASFVRGYEPVKLTTTDGAVHQGTVKKDGPDEVILTVAADKEVRVARKDIEEMKPGTVSVMPSGLDQQLTKQELADLIAFLKASK